MVTETDGGTETGLACGEISLRFLAPYKIRLTAAVGPWFWFLVRSH